MSRVAIVSWSMDGFQDTIDSRGTEWTFKSSRKALDKAGLERSDLDGVMGSDMDAYNGLTVSFGLKVCAAGGYKKQATRIQNGGIYTLHQARSKILSGKADYVLVFSEDNVRFDEVTISNISQEPVFTRDMGENYPISFAMVCSEYLSRTSATEELFAEVAEQNYQAGTENPWGHRREAYTKREILDSQPVSWPLRELMCCPVSAGSVAVILASEEAARNHKNPIWIEGSGLGTNRYWFREIDEQLALQSLSTAARKAYEMAGITDPLTQIDTAEIFNPAAPLELIQYEALGFCNRGEGPDFFHEGVSSDVGEIHVNPSGGSLVTNPLNAGGLYRAAQACVTLSGETARGGSNGEFRRAVVTDGDWMLGLRGCSDGVLVLGTE